MDMSINGRELIEWLQDLIANQSRTDEREIGKTMAKWVSPRLRQHGAEQYVDEVFDLFRRARRDAISTRSRRGEMGTFGPDRDPAFERSLQTISLEMLNWGSFDMESITKFYLEFHDVFVGLQRAFTKTRSRRSHLAAILRAFDDRLISVRDRFLDDYPTSEIRAEAHRLQNQIVTLDNLDDWTNRVFDLFVKATAYAREMNRKNNLDNVLPAPVPVQLGLIKQSSVEIYRGRWNELLTFNRKIIEAKLSDRALGGRPHLESHSPKDFFAAAYSEPMGFSQNSFVGDRSIPDSTVSVFISLAENETINAQRSWVSNDLASSEIGMWLTLLQTLWSSEGDSVKAKVSFSSSAGDSEVTVPTLTLSAAVEALPQLIRNYS
jgi:hypothetical protein